MLSGSLNLEINSGVRDILLQGPVPEGAFHSPDSDVFVDLLTTSTLYRALNFTC